MTDEASFGFTKGLPPCIIAMEACAVARITSARPSRGLQGHEVRLMSPGICADVKAQKERRSRCGGDQPRAATRPTMRFVELKR